MSHGIRINGTMTRQARVHDRIHALVVSAFMVTETVRLCSNAFVGIIIAAADGISTQDVNNDYTRDQSL